MSWGVLYFYYCCPECFKLFKYAADLIAEYGDKFGYCPACSVLGDFITEGARISEDLKYEEVD